MAFLPGIFVNFTKSVKAYGSFVYLCKQAIKLLGNEEIFVENEKIYKKANKVTIKVLKDIPGLIANRIQQGVAREVFSLMEMKAASNEDIDKALMFGPAFRYATTGQLEIADMGGLDIWYTVGNNLLKVMDNSQCANKLLKEKVETNKLGIKTGEGFFKYNKDDIEKINNNFYKKLSDEEISSNIMKILRNGIERK